MRSEYRRAVVTGAASGIGAAVAGELADNGWTVIAIDRVELPAELRGNSRVDHIQADLSAPDSIDAAVRQLGARPVDALCNVAGVSGALGADTAMRVNFLGLRHLTLSLEEQLRGGAVVNVASFVGRDWSRRLDQHRALARTESFDAGLSWLADHPVDPDFVYPYSKEVLRVWTMMLAAAWIRKPVRVNTVSPGPVETPILQQFRDTLGDTRVDADIDCVGRAGTPGDIAPVVAWLCQPEASWISGSNVTADGGLAVAAIVDSWEVEA